MMLKCFLLIKFPIVSGHSNSCCHRTVQYGTVICGISRNRCFGKYKIFSIICMLFSEFFFTFFWFQKYLNPLKSQENTGIIDAQVADEIFFMVPAILNIHERFLEVLRRRLDAWEPLQRVGDAFVEVVNQPENFYLTTFKIICFPTFWQFSKTSVLDTYTAFVNNWNRAKDAIRTTSATRSAFARFLETMAREHKGKLTLDNLLIKPVQKFPK